MINREIESNIRDDFDSRKAIVLIGARQVGKTTLVEAVAKDLDACWRSTATTSMTA